MRSPAVLLALLVPLLVAPFATAETPSCASVTQSTATPTAVYLLPPPPGVTGYTVWVEDNLVDGLQKVECVAPDGSTAAPDRYMGVVGYQHGGQPVCVPRVGCVWV